MSVSSVTDGGISVDTGGSNSTDFTGTHLPLVLVSAYKDEQAHQDKQILQPLPSNRYKFSNWHEIQLAKLRGHELKAPRVREAPPIKETTFYTTHNNHGALIHHNLKGKERRDYRNEMENWENVEICNLSYQNLSEDYQKSNFIRILKRLYRVVEVNLMHDMMVDLHSVSFPCCKVINLTGNHLDSFLKLPKMCQLEQLVLTDNNIQSLKGIETLNRMQLYLLDLGGNPVTFTSHYRQRVFKALPSLRVLDDVARLPSDDEQFIEEKSSCTIS